MSDLLLHQFQYDLPDERIARFPLARRDQSKLLVYRRGTITHTQFNQIPEWLPKNSLLVFNDTKVIPARLFFQKPTGALIELFLLNPVADDGSSRLVNEVMLDTHRSVWACMIGNRKRWKPDEVISQSLQIDGREVILSAHWHNAEQSQVRLEWTGDDSLATILHEAGSIPLPPYLKREAEATDRETYQTVYSKTEGAVAAPTAGLHFTPEVFADLAAKGIPTDYLTLHVGAGTFQPIKTEEVRQHIMHTEQVIYTEQNLQNLLDHEGVVIPVGTTSLRSLESLYWFGVRLLREEPDPFHLSQEYAYSVPGAELPTSAEAVRAILDYLRRNGQTQVVAYTGIYIMPGYRFRLCNGLVTNFHQPGSTLLLLIAALIGDDWKTVYQEALQKDYRFLSYGDSSLLLP